MRPIIHATEKKLFPILLVLYNPPKVEQIKKTDIPPV